MDLLSLIFYPIAIIMLFSLFAKISKQKLDLYKLASLVFTIYGLLTITKSVLGLPLGIRIGNYRIPSYSKENLNLPLIGATFILIGIFILLYRLKGTNKKS